MHYLRRKNRKVITMQDNSFAELRKIMVIYTVFFTVVSAIVFCWYYMTGRTLIWSHDGWTQHYTALVYFAQYCRSIIKSIIFDHQFILPEWSFYIGEGNDILQTLHYYSFGDPFAVFSVFVPTRFMWIYYDAMIILRLYLSGIAFFWLCRYTKKDMGRYAALAGMLSYVFCFWAIYNANRHPYFLNPMIYFPLIILGIEKIIRKEKPYLFTIAVFLSAISNFYFFYMIALLAVIYVLARLILIYKKDFRAIWKVSLRIAGPAVIGTMLGAIIVLPVSYAFLNDSRLGSGNAWHIFYPLSYYSGLPGTFLSTGSSYWLIMGYAAPVILAVFLLFIEKKKYTLLKTLFGICGLIIVFPALGQILNGMSYISNRWSWALALLCAYTLSAMWHDLMHLKFRTGMKLFVCLAVYFFVCLMLEYSRTITVFTGIGAAFIFLFIIFPFQMEEKTAIRWRRRKSLVSLCMVIVGIGCISFYNNAYGEGNYAAEAKEIKDVEDEFDVNETEAVKKLAETDGVDGEYYRYSGRNITKNANISADVSSTSFYWTITNANVVEYMTEMETTEATAHNHTGYDDRTSLLTLSSVLYFVVPDSDDAPIPYGFTYVDEFNVSDDVEKEAEELLKEELGIDALSDEQLEIIADATEQKYKIYRNENPLYIGYTYDAVISQEEWDDLSAIEKQEAMLQAVYLEEYEGQTTSVKSNLDSRNINFSVECNDSGVTQEDYGFVVTEENASVTLSFEGLENSETYVVIHGLEYEGISTYDLYFGDAKYDPLDLYTETGWNLLSSEEREEIRQSALFWKEPTGTSLEVQSSQGVSKTLNYYTDEYTWYNDRHDFTVNLNYSEDAVTSIDICFSGIGIYSYDSIEVVCQPFDKYEEQVASLNDEALENIELGTDTITGNITVDEPTVLCLSIPYSTGWTAYVDGQETRLYQANIKNMAIELEEGEHEIRLVYHCPLLRIGAIISFLTFVGCIVYIACTKSNKIRKQKRRETVLRKRGELS